MIGNCFLYIRDFALFSVKTSRASKLKDFEKGHILLKFRFEFVTFSILLQITIILIFRFTEEEEVIMKDYTENNPNISFAELGKLLGRHRFSVQRHFRQMQWQNKNKDEG